MARAIKLIDAPVGLFEVDGVLVLKTEYSTRHVDGTTTPDCYIVESGEHFWGGVDSVEERNNLMVTPVEMPTLTPPNEPLTIEQLREMDGEPVWVVYDQDAAKTTPGFDPLTLWALVEVTKDSVFLTNNLGGRTAYADDQDLEWAGITVYRRPPEGEV